MQSESTDKPDNPHGGGRITVVYALALVLIAVATYAFKLHTRGIFACPADGYGDRWYLAYCNSTAYGDFDHGAFWYDLVPAATASVRDAEVLLLGSSRMQFGFSTDVTRSWFDEREASFYLLGFTHTENTIFTAPLLDRIGPTPRALVINVDGFFQQRTTSPAATIFAGGDAPTRYDAKKNWQPAHRRLCGLFDGLCGSTYVIFRHQDTGIWRRFGSDPRAQVGATRVVEAQNRDAWGENLALAREFLDQIAVERHCIVLTVVPSMYTPMDEATWLAGELELPLVAPQVSDLTTFDTSHLDGPSAERWSAAFFADASRYLDGCLGPRASLSAADR